MDILYDPKIIKQRFPNKVYSIFRSSKNIEYLIYVLNTKYPNNMSKNMLAVSDLNTYRMKEEYLIDFYTKVQKFWIPIANRSYYTDNNIWDAIKMLNSKFIKYACQHIEYKYNLKKSKSYIDTALDATVLYQPGFEDMNKDIYKKTNNWGTTHLDPSGICKTAEEAEAEYYGEDYVTSEVAIGLKKKIKNAPQYTNPFKPSGTPFMVNRTPKINLLYKFNNASSGADKDFQFAQGTEGTHEMEAPIYSQRFQSQYSKR
jgi:hypothetical protein